MSSTTPADTAPVVVSTVEPEPFTILGFNPMLVILVLIFCVIAGYLWMNRSVSNVETASMEDQRESDRDVSELGKSYEL